MEEPNNSEEKTEKSIIDFDDEYSDNINENIVGEEYQPKDIEKYINNEQIKENENIKLSVYNRNESKDKFAQLNSIDLNDKQGIIDFLMEDNLIMKNMKNIKKEKSKIIFHSKYSNIKSKYLGGKMNKSAGKYNKNRFDENYQDLILKTDDKSLIKENKNLINDLLLDETNQKRTNKKILSRKQIGEKIQRDIEKKNKNLKMIEQKIYEENKYNITFIPTINNRGKSYPKRNLKEFLQDQENYQKKIDDKHKVLLDKSEEKLKEYGKPYLDQNSMKLAKSIDGCKIPAHIRLYNNRYEKSKLMEKRLKTEKEEEEMRIKEKKRSENKSNPYKHIKSKINIFQKSPSQTEGIRLKNDLSSLQKISREEENKKEQNNSSKKLKPKLLDYKDLNSKKILWSKFLKSFDEAIISLNENNNNDIKSNELNMEKYEKLLFNLGMINNNSEKDKDDINDGNNIDTNEIKLNENQCKLEEKLINMSYNLLKMDNDNVKIIDIKKFLIFVLDFQNYDFYQQYKIKHINELKDLFPENKYIKEELPELILKKQNEELLSEVDNSNKNNCKYFSISKDNKIIFTLENSPNIQKDFQLFKINYRSKRIKKNKEKNMKIVKEEFPFKPYINKNSEVLYKKFKDKLYSIPNDIKDSTYNYQIDKGNMDYFNRILLLDKKKILENQKIKNEMRQKEIKECTFQPNISKYSPQKNGTSNKKYQVKNNQKNKFEELYEDGKKKMLAKINKLEDEIELERNPNKYTFHPNTKSLNTNKISLTKFNNDIYNEIEYQNLYRRLENGRLERLVKKCNNERYELSKELKHYIKDSKEFNYIDNNEYSQPNENNKYEEINNKSNYIEVRNNSMNNGQGNLPSFIIDVYIKPGMKKSIYVYKYDTPEYLAEKFAKENKLDNEMKKKLQILIQNHMKKTLYNIQEEI